MYLRISAFRNAHNFKIGQIGQYSITQNGCILVQEIGDLCELTLSSTFGFCLGFTRPFWIRNFEHLNFLLVFL